MANNTIPNPGESAVSTSTSKESEEKLLAELATSAVISEIAERFGKMLVANTAASEKRVVMEVAKLLHTQGEELPSKIVDRFDDVFTMSLDAHVADTNIYDPKVLADLVVNSLRSGVSVQGSTPIAATFDPDSDITSVIIDPLQSRIEETVPGDETPAPITYSVKVDAIKQTVSVVGDHIGATASVVFQTTSFIDMLYDTTIFATDLCYAMNGDVRPTLPMTNRINSLTSSIAMDVAGATIARGPGNVHIWIANVANDDVAHYVRKWIRSQNDGSSLTKFE